MGDPRRVRPDEVEILVARELRKAGIPLSKLSVVSRRALAAQDESQYVMELTGPPGGAATQGIIIEFRNEAGVVDVDTIRALATRLPAARNADGPKRLQPANETSPDSAAVAPLRVMMSTAGFDLAAATEARSLGIMLLRIADGGAAFLRSQWAMGDQPPAWVPEYMAELVDVGPAGDVRYQMITGPAKRTSH